MRPLISVVVPAYNMERYLDRCLQSIARQTLERLEVKIIDDGSTDHTSGIAYEWTTRDPRFQLIRQENLGLSAARNAGIAHSTAPYIGFVDADDWIDMDFYELLYGMITHYDAQIAACGFVKEKGEGGLLYSELEAHGNTDISKTVVLRPAEGIAAMFAPDGMRYSACDKLFCRSLFDRIRFPLGSYYEDKGTMYKWMHLCSRIVYNSSKKYHYFMRDDGIMNQDLNSHHFDILEVNEQLLTFLDAFYPELSHMGRESFFKECERLMDKIERAERDGILDLSAFNTLKERVQEVLKEDFMK